MRKLVLLRHGESLWNQENKFTGWMDVNLSSRGVAEAKQAGKLMSEAGFSFDLVYCSVLKRAIRTMWLALEELDQMWIPQILSWRLNERHYGALQGLNKAETTKKFGEEQILSWRRSYDTPPPALEPGSEMHPKNDPRYREVREENLPVTECLKDTVARFLPFWDETIKPEILNNKSVLIVAHGNTLRALIKHLDQITEEDIVRLTEIRIKRISKFDIDKAQQKIEALDFVNEEGTPIDKKTKISMYIFS